MIHIPYLYTATIETKTTKEVNIVGETPEEAQAKAEAQLQEGETVGQVVDKGPVVA